MEINTQQMDALLKLQEQQAQLPRKQTGQATGFEALLNRQLESNPAQPAQDTGRLGRAEIYSQILVDEAAPGEQLDPDSAVLLEAFEQASGTLDLWDSYAKTLGTSATDTALRDAWGLLQGIDAQVAGLRDHPARGKSSALDSILNELEVMATTEKFKFNRGDYL